MWLIRAVIICSRSERTGQPVNRVGSQRGRGLAVHSEIPTFDVEFTESWRDGTIRSKWARIRADRVQSHSPHTPYLRRFGPKHNSMPTGDLRKKIEQTADLAAENIAQSASKTYTTSPTSRRVCATQPRRICATLSPRSFDNWIRAAAQFAGKSNPTSTTCGGPDVPPNEAVASSKRGRHLISIRPLAWR